MATTSSVAAPAITPAAKVTAVRVEDESSIGRSYSKKAEVVKGLGAERRKLRTTTWRDAYGIGSSTPSTLESFTLAKVNLATCTKEDLLAYLKNTWDLTTTLFAALADDSVLYAVPDKLRRPLIFYSAHPAALYANKMHQAGLMGEWSCWRVGGGKEGRPLVKPPSEPHHRAACQAAGLPPAAGGRSDGCPGCSCTLQAAAKTAWRVQCRVGCDGREC